MKKYYLEAVFIILLIGLCNLSNASVIATSPTTVIKNGWNLISLPMTPIDGNPATVLSGINMSNASLQYWDNASQTGGGYYIYPISWQTPMNVSDAYWIIETSDKTLSYLATPNDTSDKTIQIPAHSKAPYWAMIGMPYERNISCDKIKFIVGGDTKVWADAITAGWIQPVAQGWDASSQGYFNAGLDTNPAVARSYLESWHGYWLLISTTSAITISFPVPTAGLANSAWPKFHAGNQNKGRGVGGGATNNQKWAFQTGGAVYSSPAIGEDDTIYVGSYDHKLYALDGSTGNKKWAFETGNSIWSSPAIGVDGTVYIGSTDYKVYAVDGVTGTEKWQYTTGDWVASSPAIGADDTVYIGGYDNKVMDEVQ